MAYERHVLFGETDGPILLERGTHVFQASDRFVVDAPCLPGDVEEEIGEIDDIDARLLTAVMPIGIEHALDQIWSKEFTEGGKTVDGEANAHGFANEDDELGAADLDRVRLAGWALEIGRASCRERVFAVV